jgi:hypothetical protein
MSDAMSHCSFFTNNYIKLLNIAKKQYGQEGENIAHEAIRIALERYDKITISLMILLFREGARSLRNGQWSQNDDGTIILPPTEEIGVRVADAVRQSTEAAGDVRYEFRPGVDSNKLRKWLRKSEKKGQAVMAELFAERIVPGEEV